MEIWTYFREPGGSRATWEAKSLFEKNKTCPRSFSSSIAQWFVKFLWSVYRVFVCACGECFVLGSPPESGDLLGESVNEAGSSNDIHVSLPLVLLVSSLDVVSLRVVSLLRPVRFCATASYALLAFTQTVLPCTATSARFP
uniref:Uncharacterized protein n=1 Tax=Ixodes ricinus TaxID=34613 RepID=A0A0K8RNA5_IXORI